MATIKAFCKLALTKIMTRSILHRSLKEFVGNLTRYDPIADIIRIFSKKGGASGLK